MLRNTHTHTCIQYMLNHIWYTHAYTYAYLYGMYQQGNVSEWQKFVMNSLACLRNKFFSFFFWFRFIVCMNVNTLNQGLPNFFCLVVHYTINSSAGSEQSSNMQLHTRLTEFLLTLVFLYTHAFSLQNVLKVEVSRSRLLENSIATTCICAFSYLSVPHACCYWFICKVFDVFISVN